MYQMYFLNLQKFLILLKIYSHDLHRALFADHNPKNYKRDNPKTFQRPTGVQRDIPTPFGEKSYRGEERQAH